MKDPLLPPPNSKKRNLGERKPSSLPHFRFLKMGEIQRGSILPKTRNSCFAIKVRYNFPEKLELFELWVTKLEFGYQSRKFMMVWINEGPPPASPKFQKTEFGGEKAWFSPPFSFFENGGDTEGVNFPLKTTTVEKKRFFLEFQIIFLTL